MIFASVYAARKKLNIWSGVVHHIDLNPKNNSSDNLIILENQKEHMNLHARKNKAEGTVYGKPKKATGTKISVAFDQETLAIIKQKPRESFSAAVRRIIKSTKKK